MEKPLENRSPVVKITKNAIFALALITMVIPATAQLAPAPSQGRVCLPKEVLMISADWCVVCKRAAKFFIEKGVRYTEFDYKHSETGRFLYSNYKYNTGKEGVPVIIFMEQNLALDGVQPKSALQVDVPRLRPVNHNKGLSENYLGLVFFILVKK